MERDDTVDGGIFGRPVSELTDGGRLSRELWRATMFPRTMERETVLKGGLIGLASVLYLPLPLLGGYLLAVIQAAGEDRAAPAFGNW